MSLLELQASGRERCKSKSQQYLGPFWVQLVNLSARVCRYSLVHDLGVLLRRLSQQLLQEIHAIA